MQIWPMELYLFHIRCRTLVHNIRFLPLTGPLGFDPARIHLQYLVSLVADTVLYPFYILRLWNFFQISHAQTKLETFGFERLDDIF
jgi:hypothetical protein